MAAAALCRSLLTLFVRKRGVIEQVDVVVVGPVEESLLSRYRQTVGVRRVLRCMDSSLSHLPADATASLLAHLNETQKPSYICAASSSVGKDVLPRVGGLLDVQPVTDVVQIKNNGNGQQQERQQQQQGQQELKQLKNSK
ncbi:hypothetical protein ACSSS7_004001 [Eimeria intestinalis]